MTALLIIGGIILFILFLLYIPVVVDIDFLNKKLSVRVKYLIFTFFSIPADPKKKKRRKKTKKIKKSKTKKKKNKESSVSSEKEESSSKTDETDKNCTDELSEEDKELLTGKKAEKPEKEKKPYKEPLSDKVNFVSELIKKCRKNVFKIVRDIGIKKLNLTIVVASPDASQTALAYGKISTAVWNTAALLQNVMKRKFSAKSIRIGADFLSEKTEISASVKITVTPAVVLGNLIAAAVKALVVIVKRKNKLKNAEKSSGKE